MTLARVWTRHLYGASAVALLAPATMIAVLVVLALGGGFGGLSALGQLVSGPAVPVGLTLPGGRVPHTATPVLPVVPASRVTRPAPAATSPGPSAARRSGAGGSGRGGASGGGGVQRVASGGHGAAAPPSTPTQPAPTVSTPAPTPTPPPATAPIPAIVNQVVAVGVSVTSKLPAPLATVGTSALESVGQVLNRLLAPQS